MKQVIEYIQKNYDPLCLILYGSYADGTNRLNSDFDALVITADHEPFHDTSLVAGIPLDVFVYPARYFEGAYACEDFVQIFDGRVIMDRHDIGKSLLANVQAYLQNRPEKTSAEIQANIDWCVIARGCSVGIGCWSTAWRFSAISCSIRILGLKKH